MPLDVTAYFKAKGKTIAQRKAKEEANGGVVTERSAEAGPSLSYRTLARGAARTADDIHDLAQAILAKRREYLNFNAPMAVMTNADRDAFDRDSEKALRALGDAVQRMADKVKEEKPLAEQEKQHLTAVCGLLERDLKKMGRVVTEMRKLRLTAMTNRRELSRLSTLVEGAAKKEKKRETGEDTPPPELRRRKPTPLVPQADREPLVAQNAAASAVALTEATTPSDEPELPPERVADLMVENDKLFAKFTNVHSTVTGLETQIFEIQRLQETFSDKVFDQEKEIEFINETAVNTTENLRDGNEWIRQAISNSAGRRVILLFCIVVLSFTLLFLDWYNP